MSLFGTVDVLLAVYIMLTFLPLLHKPPNSRFFFPVWSISRSVRLNVSDMTYLQEMITFD